MGCMFSSHSDEDAQLEDNLNEESVVKQYSWDKRESIRQRDNTVSTIQNISDTTTLRKPGSCTGHHIVLQDCKNCSIFLFDSLSSVVMENCYGCTTYLGPTETNVTLRDCADCTVLSSCQQFTTKNCHRLTVFLCCASRPLIDNSKNIKFSCVQLYYPQLEDQLHRAQLSVYNNFWSNIHDNSANENSNNFEILPETTSLFDFITPPECFAEMAVTCDSLETIVPYMPSERSQPSENSCLVMFFNDGLSHDRARSFIRLMKQQHPKCAFVQGRELVIKEHEASDLFASDKYSMAVKQGPVIGLEYMGLDSRHNCQEVLVSVSKGSTGLVFITSSKDAAANQVETFRRLADLKLGCTKTTDPKKKKVPTATLR